MKLIQEEWKKAGYLPRKISNSLWNDFKPLVNKFYDILKSGVINLDENDQKIYDKKSKLIENLKFSKKKFTKDELKEEFISSIQSFNEIGELNLNSSTILNLNLLENFVNYKTVDLDKAEKDNLIFDFELELSKLTQMKSIRKFKLLREKYRIS